MSNKVFCCKGPDTNRRNVAPGGTIEFEGIGPTTPEGVPIATKPVRIFIFLKNDSS